MPSSGRVKERKLKTKTFTGCWTCRARKVKCDSIRPTCHRCTKAGLHCGGYDVKLYWVDERHSVLPTSVKRQAMSLISERPSWILSADELERQIAAVDEIGASDNGAMTASSSFGLFYLQADDEHVQPIPDRREATVEQLENDTPTDSGFLLAKSTISNQIRFSPLPLNSLAHSEVGLYCTALVHMLLNHYVQNVANILQPIVHPQNTYNSLYSPSAMGASQNLLLDSTNPTFKPPASRIAIFYSLLATAAFHLRGSNEAADLDGLAGKFRANALSYLQTALKTLPDPRLENPRTERINDLGQLEGALSAMLTLVTADVMDGCMSEFWMHLEAANQIATRLREHAESRPNSERLVNIASFLKIIADSTSTDLDPLPWSDHFDAFAREESFLGDGNGLEFTYGITTRLANLIRCTTILSRCISYYAVMDGTLPATLISQCERLFRLISSWSISSESLSSISGNDPTTLLLAKKHIMAFAQSIQIYYHTKVLPCAASQMSSYVQTVATHLNEIEVVKRTTGYDKVLTASVSWPGFIASCEAEPQHRDVWYDWWTTMLEYRIGNISHLWSVVREAWRLRDRGINETPAWFPVLRRSKKRILAV